MKVAALYDVHGMPHALEAVLAGLDADVELVLFGGDLIGGPFPRRVVDIARGVPGARYVRGNAEREPDERDCAELDDARLAWLAALPLTASIDGVLYCHAAPGDDTTLTTAATSEEALRETFGSVEEGVVVIGHTHHQFDRAVDGVRVVNAGSVGMPYEGEVAAFWALVEDGEPSFRRTQFDVERAAAEILASGWPGAEAFVAENLLAAVSREEAIAVFEGARG